METTTARKYYYRPIRLFNGEVLKCAGFGAENSEHRAFFEKYYSENADNSFVFMPGCTITESYLGDRITADGAEFLPDKRHRHGRALV